MDGWDEREKVRTGCSSLVVFIVAVLLMLVSCATKTKVEYVDRDVIKYETVQTHDTVISLARDSIYHTIMQKDDTVYETKYVERIKYLDRIQVRTDTITRDSVQTVVREQTKTKKVIPAWCYVSVLVAAACMGLLIYKARK